MNLGTKKNVFNYKSVWPQLKISWGRIQSDYLSIKFEMKKLPSQGEDFLGYVTKWIKKEVILED